MFPLVIKGITEASANPFDHPSILFNYLSTEKDRKEWCEAIRCSRQIIETKAMDEFRGEEISPGTSAQTDEEILDFVAREGESAYHPSGTCKMGTDDMAVVDSALRVHGVDHLWVADASVIPLITNGNIYAPVLMIAEKMADEVLGNTPLTPADHAFYKHEL